MARTVWYPGHMARGGRKLSELVERLDLIVEVRDARAHEMGRPAPAQKHLPRLVFIRVARVRQVGQMRHENPPRPG